MADSPAREDLASLLPRGRRRGKESRIPLAELAQYLHFPGRLLLGLARRHGEVWDPDCKRVYFVEEGLARKLIVMVRELQSADLDYHERLERERKKEREQESLKERHRLRALRAKIARPKEKPPRPPRPRKPKAEKRGASGDELFWGKSESRQDWSFRKR